MQEKQHSEIVVGDGTGEDQATPDAPAAASEAKQPEADRVFLIPYPKIVFLYPTYFASIICGFVMLFSPQDGPISHIVGFGFLALAGLNLIVLSFDFPRATSLTLFFFLVALGIGLWMLFTNNPDLVPVIGTLIASIQPEANATFYFFFAVFMTLLYVAVFISVRFDYWEVRPNELLHHHGVLSDLKRYSAPQLRIEKEINDIFEYFLLGAGRLILHPKNEMRSVVLDNVFFINAKEQKITRILSALRVRVNTD